LLGEKSQRGERFREKKNTEAGWLADSVLPPSSLRQASPGEGYPPVPEGYAAAPGLRAKRAVREGNTGHPARAPPRNPFARVSTTWKSALSLNPTRDGGTESLFPAKAPFPQRPQPRDGRGTGYRSREGGGFGTGRAGRALGPVGAPLRRSLPHVSSSRRRKVPQTSPLAVLRDPAGSAREGRAGGGGAGAGAAQIPPAETGGSGCGGEVKERGLSLRDARPGPFWCNGIITAGRASLSKHTRPAGQASPGD